MSTTFQIRLIKSGERKRLRREDVKTEIPASSPQEAVREMVATVSSWINELRQKRLDEDQTCRRRLGRQQVPGRVRCG